MEDFEAIENESTIKESKTDPAKIWEEYQKLVNYLTENNVYNIVKKNEDFFDGRHWEGVGNNNDMAKPTMNTLQRIGKYEIAMLASNDVGISIKSMLGDEDEDQRLNFISSEVKDVIEQAKIKENARLMIRDAYVGGAAYFLQTFDPDFETGQDSKGRIENELVDIRRMYFGNPYSSDIQKQPYIIVALRQYVGQVKEEAEELGVPYSEIEKIKADSDENYDNDTDGKLVTVLLKFYKKKHKILVPKIVFNTLTGMEEEIFVEKEVKTVHFTKSTQEVIIKDETDLGYTRYPISRFGWDNRKDSFLFDTPMTWNIVNQVFINKCYAYCHEYAFKSAFPKRIYDQTKIDLDDWDSSNDIGVAGMDLMGKVLDFEKMPDFSNQIIELIKTTEAEMEKNMGVNDAALGNVKPDNAQAIISLQEAAAIPIEIQRQNFYDMWEDTIRNIIDIMIAQYGIRKIALEDNKGIATVDFSQLQGLNYRLTVDISSSGQWSEVMQVNNYNALLNGGHIDLKTFIDVMPDKALGQKGKLKKFAEEQEQAMKQAQQLARMQGVNQQIG